jgi:hypothetical protein
MTPLRTKSYPLVASHKCDSLCEHIAAYKNERKTHYSVSTHSHFRWVCGTLFDTF